MFPVCFIRVQLSLGNRERQVAICSARNPAGSKYYPVFLCVNAFSLFFFLFFVPDKPKRWWEKVTVAILPAWSICITPLLREFAPKKLHLILKWLNCVRSVSSIWLLGGCIHYVLLLPPLCDQKWNLGVILSVEERAYSEWEEAKQSELPPWRKKEKR